MLQQHGQCLSESKCELEIMLLSLTYENPVQSSSLDLKVCPLCGCSAINGISRSGLPKHTAFITLCLTVKTLGIFIYAKWFYATEELLLTDPVKRAT